MFINTAMFKKLVKEAYNNQGLTVGNDGGGTFFEGGYWVLRVENGYLPNKEKAAVIEKTGELPEAGEVFKAMKKYGNQREIEWKDAWDINGSAEDAKERVNPTDLLIVEENAICRLMQTENREILSLDEKLYQLVDNTCIDRREEDEAEGPFRSPGGKVLYWKNSICTYAACIRKTEDEKELEILSHLEKMRLIKR